MSDGDRESKSAGNGDPQSQPTGDAGQGAGGQGQGGGGQGQGDGTPEHKHPGGTAAILGVQLLRFAGVQGLSLGAANLLHYGSILAVGAILGASDLGKYSLLLFLTGLVTQIIHIATKPGTIRRVFGSGDDDDEDDEDDDDAQPTDVSDRPPWTLGVGIVLCIGLSAIFAGAAVAFQNPIAQVLLGNADQGRMVMWAALTAGMLAIFRLTEIAIWFEQRPGAFLLVDTARPALNLVFIITLCLAGMDLEGSVLGALIGTTIATVLSLVVLRNSFDWAWSGREAVEILKLSRRRVPVVTSMWLIQNVDTFILSRFVDHHELGIYNLASRTGFAVALLPQGFRVALRPLRRGTAYLAMKREYGTQTAHGQLLAYFLLLCITSILAMFLLGEALVHDAAGDFASAGGLIPLAAAAMAMPALFRTVNSMAIEPRGRKPFVIGIVVVAVTYIGLAFLIVPKIGIYGPPTALLLGFVGPLLYVSLRSQLSEQPIEVPYWSLVRAVAVAVAIGVFFELFHPSGRWLQLAEIAGLMALWFAALLALRIVPEHHRRPLLHMARSTFRGSALHFSADEGLRKLPPNQREVLHDALAERRPASEIQPEGERLVKVLRRAGRRGDAAVGPVTELDAEMAIFLFSDEPAASRHARLRELLAQGADSNDIRVLEDIIKQLEKMPDAAWNGEDGGRRLRLPGRNGRGKPSG
jgi:O-antigen/teichoic acid export membrane protein